MSHLGLQSEIYTHLYSTGRTSNFAAITKSAIARPSIACVISTTCTSRQFVMCTSLWGGGGAACEYRVHLIRGMWVLCVYVARHEHHLHVVHVPPAEGVSVHLANEDRCQLLNRLPWKKWKQRISQALAFPRASSVQLPHKLPYDRRQAVRHCLGEQTLGCGTHGWWPSASATGTSLFTKSTAACARVACTQVSAMCASPRLSAPARIPPSRPGR